MSSPVDEHLSWLATRYVLGELSEADRDAFELRLADDLAACEAVTEASRFVLTARAALVQPALIRSADVTQVAVPVSSPRSADRSIRSAWLAVVTAATAVAIAFLFSLRTPDSGNSSVVVTPDPAAAELVSLWRTGVDAGDAESEEVDGELADDDVAVPGWMLAAVSLEARGSLDGPSGKVQEN